MLFRAIALSIALLVGIGTVIPYMTDSTEAGPRRIKKKKKRYWRGVKKYSKRWWQLYRAQERRKKVLRARKRALMAKRILLARKKAQAAARKKVAPVRQISNPEIPTRTRVAAVDNSPAVLPSGAKAPSTFSQSVATDRELQFNVSDNGGGQLGTAALSVVGPAVGESSSNGRIKLIGGVPTTSLRRNVIDKMMREEGWVVNDYQKNINGKNVYVVEAQSSSKGSVQSRLFYFTEVDGRIYSLSTTSPNSSQERIAQESEKVIQSLQRGSRSVQAGLK